MKTSFTLAIILAATLMGKLLSAQCIDPSQIDSTVACFAVYQPVCGCDGITYTNYCHAENYGGVTSYTQGVCSTTVEQCCQARFDYESVIGIAGYTVTFNNQSTGCFTEQYWDFGDGNGTYAFEPGHTYLATQFPPDGRAKVCLSVYNLPDSCYDKICGYVYFDRTLNPCVDSSLITGNACGVPVVTVCGCNGVQYSSGCAALNSAGVTSWYMGACPASSACAASFEYETSATPVGYQVNFSNTTVTDSTTYAWSFGDGGTSTLRSPGYLYTVPGNYTACLTVTDTANNCTSTYCRFLRVHDPICVDSATIVGNPICPAVEDPVCGCNGTTYDNDCIAAAAGVKYWRPGACGTQQCYAYFDFAIDSASGQVTFTNRSTASTFMQWNFGNNNTSTLENPVHTFAVPGIYPVCLSITSGSCTGRYCDTLFLDFTGIADDKLMPLAPHIYPNPFSGEVSIQFPDASQAITVWVTDLNGKRVATLTENSIANHFRWDASAQAPGYYLLFSQGNGHNSVQKLLLLR